MNKKQIANIEMKDQTLAILDHDKLSVLIVPSPPPNLCGSSEMTWG